MNTKVTRTTFELKGMVWSFSAVPQGWGQMVN